MIGSEPPTLTRDDCGARIARLPIVNRWTEEHRDRYQRHLIRPDAPLNDDGTPFKLHVDQAWAVAAYQQLGGLIAPLDVGAGKTLIGLLIARIGVTLRKKKRVLLLINSPVASQLIKTDIPWARERVYLEDLPIHTFHQTPKVKKERMIRSPQPGLYILTYNLLSREDGLRIMRALSPDLIIADECHTLANESGRTKKFWGVCQELSGAGKEPELVAMSGTLVRKSLIEMHNMCKTALGDNSPMPININMTALWDQEFGATAAGRLRPPLQEVQFLGDWARTNFPEEKWTNDLSGIRTAFRKRFTTAPGVVASTTASTPVRLEIKQHDSLPLNAETKVAISELETYGLLPNGERVPTPMHAYTYLTQLACGFYYDLRWPAPGQYTADQIDAAIEHHAVEQAYASACFKWIKRSPLEYSTPGDIERAIADRDPRIPGDICALFQESQDKRPEVPVERDQNTVWFDRSKLEAAVDIATEGGKFRPIWAHHHAVHYKIREILFERGIPYEDVVGTMSADNLRDPKKMDRVYIVSSVKGKEGLNLQHYDEMVWAEVTRNGSMWHQMMGRTHRNGQKSSVVRNHLVLTEGTDHDTLAACMIESINLHQILTGGHKAVIAAWSPPPKFPSREHLRAKVPSVEDLDVEAARPILAKFGIQQ